MGPCSHSPVTIGKRKLPTPHPESWGTYKQDENRKWMQIHSSGRSAHLHAHTRPMLAKRRQHRKGSHWAERNFQEIKSSNATLCVDKASRQKGLSALPLVSRVTLAKSHKPFVTMLPRKSKLSHRNLVSFEFWYSEFFFPCNSVLISTFIIVFLKFAIQRLFTVSKHCSGSLHYFILT